MEFLVAPALAAPNPVKHGRPLSGRGPASDQADFDQSVVSKAGHADASAGRPAVRREKAAIGPIHRLIVFLEIRQVDPRHHHVFEPKAKAGKYGREIGDNIACLCFDAFGQDARCF